MRFAGRHCKTLYNYPSPDGGFRLISLLRPYSTVHTVIKKLQDEAIDPQSLLNSGGAPRKQELMLLIKNLKEVLKELDEIIRKYQGPARRQRRIWNQFRLATENLDGIRSKLTFHVTAINAFTSSLSCGTLAQIETVLVELVSEVRQGRRQPSLASLHETNNDSVWGELEAELAGDGISSTVVANHKAAIKVFVQRLLTGSDADTTSLVEVASPMERGTDNTGSESLSHGLFAMGLSPGDWAELPATANAQNGSVASMDSEEYESGEEYESADEELPPEHADASNPAGRVSLEDAFTYLDNVQELQSQSYSQFLDIMSSFKRGDLDTPGVIDRTSTLFICHPEIIHDFTFFLPDGYRIECGTVDNRYAFRVITPFSAYIRIPDLQAMQSLTMEGGNPHILGPLKWIDPASLNILRPYPGVATPLVWTTDQPASRVSGGVSEARMIFASRLKALLARLATTKETATDTDRSDDERNRTTHVSDRLGLAVMSLRRAPRP